MKILIVEDQFMSRRILQKIFEDYGTCDLASDGTEALEAFQLAHRSERPYDLIVMDIVMPEKDGMSALQEIRAWEGKRNIQGLDRTKIVMATVSRDSDNVLGSFRSGCDGYITKPFRRDQVIADLKKYFIELG